MAELQRRLNSKLRMVSAKVRALIKKSEALNLRKGLCRKMYMRTLNSRYP